VPDEPEPSLARPHPQPASAVTCPECGAEDAVIVFAHFGEDGCFCPSCQHVWVRESQR